MKYYATLTTPEGKVIDLSKWINANGYFLGTGFALKGALESNADMLICDNNQLTSINAPNAEYLTCSKNEIKSLNAPNVVLLDCSNNQLPSINTPNVISLSCENNLLTNINAPNVMAICCDNNPLKALVKDCGKEKRQIWSQKVGDIIYTYIDTNRFSKEAAINWIHSKYTGKAAADYIEKVKLSQSKAA